MGKDKVNKWIIEIEFVDKGEPLLSNLTIGKNERFYHLVRDIKEDLNYYFRKMNDVFKSFKIIKIRRK